MISVGSPHKLGNPAITEQPVNIPEQFAQARELNCFSNVDSFHPYLLISSEDYITGHPSSQSET